MDVCVVVLWMDGAGCERMFVSGWLWKWKWSNVVVYNMNDAQEFQSCLWAMLNHYYIIAWLSSLYAKQIMVLHSHGVFVIHHDKPLLYHKLARLRKTLGFQQCVTYAGTGKAKFIDSIKAFQGSLCSAEYPGWLNVVFSKCRWNGPGEHIVMCQGGGV